KSSLLGTVIANPPTCIKREPRIDTRPFATRVARARRQRQSTFWAVSRRRVMLATTEDGRLALEDGSSFAGKAFAWRRAVAGEVVFNTGMVGYPGCLTDPSYAGQILVLTYPLIGNYGVPGSGRGRFDSTFESGRIQVSGVVLMEGCAEASHWNSSSSF